MSQIKISVIIPVYNTEKYIKRCLRSVQEQTLSDIEIIVADDGSSDNSYNICREIAAADSRIVLLHKENGGASSARNLALSHVRGEYIAFVDSDDYIRKSALEDAYNALCSNQSDIAVYGIEYVYDENTPPVCAADRDNNSTAPECIVLTNETLMQYYFRDRPYYIGTILCNKVFRAAIWHDIRLREGIMNEDADIMYKILAAADSAIYIDRIEYIQYVRRGSVTNRSFHHGRMNRLRIAEDTKEYIRSRYSDNDELYGLAVIEAGMNCKDILKEIVSAGKDNNSEDYKELMQFYRKNNREMHRYMRLDVKKYIRITGSYLFRNIKWIIKYL